MAETYTVAINSICPKTFSVVHLDNEQTDDELANKNICMQNVSPSPLNVSSLAWNALFESSPGHGLMKT
ncbi:unnamed protein product [Euphydryas editha]|uniref:Uncharacterized protein n=1 Tax=Euphydryas editha TaxID=104508 RepID=A0AAU9UBL9_EUPED|nr:unnamed protein product [Euphydryas editha]